MFVTSLCPIFHLSDFIFTTFVIITPKPNTLISVRAAINICVRNTNGNNIKIGLALAFTNTVGAVAEELKHHPDIELGWGYVRLKITTHDAGGTLTEKDFALAQRIDQLS